MSRLQPAVRLLLAVAIGFSPLTGCRTSGEFTFDEPPVGGPPPPPRQIETADVDEPLAPEATQLTDPLTINTPKDPENWFLTLAEVFQITLANSDVIRDLGGRVVTSPLAAPSVYDPALQEIDPLDGVEAALSDFDAQLASNIFFNRDEQTLNNLFFGGGTVSLVQNTANYNLELSKQSATGASYALRNITTYNRNNSPANRFRSAYNTAMEMELRQPLLRGRGIDFNRIAGPNSQPGVYNGVVLARMRTDIALADFETNVRDLMRNVEGAYWNLYYAFRLLDARSAAYESSLASWRNVQDQLEAGTSDAEQEGLARANFYLVQASVQNALTGGPAVRGVGVGGVGVYSAERQLRRLMGLPANDGRLIRPADEPSAAERIFDFQESLEMALARRVELRRQRWVVRQREAELLAARNFLFPQLDMVGLYRWRGFGDDLFGKRNIENGSAFRDLFAGDLEGWQMGLQYSTRLGRRRDHAAVRHAELLLARERAVLRNQELEIANGLSEQFSEMQRAYAVSRSNFNRAIAQRQRLDAAQAKYDAGEELLFFVLDAQRETSLADSDYYQSLSEHSLAVADLHLSRGSYLDYCGVQLSEGPWSPDSYRAYRKEFRRFKPTMDYCLMTPSRISRGPYQQQPANRESAELNEGVPEESSPEAAPVDAPPADGPRQDEMLPEPPLYEDALPSGSPANVPAAELPQSQAAVWRLPDR